MTARLGLLCPAHPHSGGFANGVTATPLAELVGVADGDNTTRGQEFAADHGVEYRSVEELLSDVDGVGVFSTTKRHAHWIRKAAEYGVDIICEKPLATTGDEAASIVEDCEAMGVTLAMRQPQRLHVLIRRAGHAMRRGEIGEVKSVVGTNRVPLPRWLRWPNWRHAMDPEENGGGAVIDHTVHVVDIARALTGAEVTEVYAELATRFGDHEIEDTNMLSMELSNGAQFTHDGSWSRPENWPGRHMVTVRVVGTGGVIGVDSFDGTVTKVEQGKDGRVTSVNYAASHNRRFVEDFVGAVQGEHPPAVSGRDGANEAAVVEAAYRSHEVDTPVQVDLPFDI